MSKRHLEEGENSSQSEEETKRKKHKHSEKSSKKKEHKEHKEKKSHRRDRSESSDSSHGASRSRDKEREKERKEAEDERNEKEEKEKRERREREEKERERREREEREREREREREKERERDRDRREKDAAREKEKDRRDRSRERSDIKEKADKSRQPAKTGEESKPDAESERLADEAYRRRVEEQLKEISSTALSSSRAADSATKSDSTAEDPAEARRRRRAELLAKFQSESTKVDEPAVAASSSVQVTPQIAQPSVENAKANPPAELATSRTAKGKAKVESEPKEDDMFADDYPVAGGVNEQGELPGTTALTSVDNWDDHEGYYIYRSGDLLGPEGRYRVYAKQGRGVFSTVLRVRDIHFGNRELAVKIIRNNDVMRKAGERELEICQLLSSKDPENKKHCVRLESFFEHRNHLCMLFEPLHLNLREVLKKFGGVGIHMSAVRSYAKQLFISLKHLKKCNILHGDIKPDNILVNESMNVLKLCDFGSAGMVVPPSQCEITPYLVSRFYRPPEICLGLPYDHSVDLWSVGCALFELYTGKILFNGGDNNAMLRMQMEIKGSVSKKMVKRAFSKDKHFDEQGNFLQKKTDTLTGQELISPVHFEAPPGALLKVLNKHVASSVSAQERKKISQLADLLDKIFILDPAHRIPVEKALTHPFVVED